MSRPARCARATSVLAHGRATSLAAALAVLAWAPSAPGGDEFARQLLDDRAEAEEFLRTARVIRRESLTEGVTRSQRLTLKRGDRVARATWKTIDVHHPGLWRDARGSYQFDFRDSWKHEVAAYRLDKLLGLDLVPPTVARRIEGPTGSLQLWVEDVMTETERMERGVEPTGPREKRRWHDQIHCVRLLHQLTYNTDYFNVDNLLVDSDFRVWVIDFSRAFRIQHELLVPEDLQCFSRRVLERLRGLDRPLLEETLGDMLDRRQIEGLLARRDAILEIVQVRLEENGPGKTLFQ